MDVSQLNFRATVAALCITAVNYSEMRLFDAAFVGQRLWPSIPNKDSK